MSSIGGKQKTTFTIFSLAMNAQKLALAFGAALRMYRQEKRLTQTQLSDRVGVVPSFISSLEKGKKLPSMDMLLRLAAALEIRSGTLMEATEALMGSLNNTES